MSRRAKWLLGGAVVPAAVAIAICVYAGSVVASTTGTGAGVEAFSLAIGSGPGQVGYVEANGDVEAWGPWSFTVLNNGTVAILDAANQRLLVVDRVGKQVQSIPYSELGLTSPMDIYEWRGRLAIAEYGISSEAVVLVDLSSRHCEDRIELPDGLAEAGPRFMGTNDGGLQLVLGGTEAHTVAVGARGQDLATIKRADRALDVPGVGRTSVASGVSARVAGPGVSIVRANDQSRIARNVSADNVAAQRVRPLGANPAGNLLVDTSYFVPAGERVQVKFYVEELSRDTLDTLATVTVPTEEFHVWPHRYLAVDQKGQVWCMVAAKDRVSFRILEPTSGKPDVNDGAIARAMEGFVQRIGAALKSAITPPVAYADSPSQHASPWTRTDGNNVRIQYTHINWVCNAEAYYRSCGGSNNGRPRYLSATFPFQYAGVSYCWGKWTWPTTFRDSVNVTGHDAGDIYSPNTETCTYGTDCSGLVSRIWGLSVKHSTGGLPTHSTKLSDSTPLTGLVGMDVFNLPGAHVVCFCAPQGTGGDSFYAAEATTRNSVDRCVYWTRSRSELMAAGYHMYRYLYWTN